MKLKIPARVEDGNPKNWPRQIARKYPRTLDATSKLLGNVNEMNLRFAVTEFTFERESIARAACAALCREAGCAKLPGCQTWLAPESHPMGYGYPLKEHDPRCPESLAARIEALGAEKKEG